MADLSMKTAKKQFYELGETIRDLEIKTDEFVKTIKFIEKKYPGQNEWINFYRANVTLNLIYLDFCAALRLYLDGETNYEERFAIKNLHVIIKEGYKRIYGFGEKAQNKGVWRHDIRPIVSIKSTLEEEATKVDSYLASFEDDLITKAKDADNTCERDLAIHFLDLMNEIRRFCYLCIPQQSNTTAF